MRPRGLQAIALMRRKVEEMRLQPHLELCTCCQDDLALIAEDPLCSAAEELLDRVRVRCGLPSRKKEDE